MRLLPLALALVMATSGCFGFFEDEDAPAPQEPRPGPVALNSTYWLKNDLSLSPFQPQGDTKQVAVAPGQNAYANEALTVFSSDNLGSTSVVETAHLELWFRVTQTVVVPFTNGTGSQQGRLFIFWLGAAKVYPSYAQAFTPAVLQPGTTYHVAVDIPLTQGGLILGGGRSLDLLVITTASNQEGHIVLLTSGNGTDSRLELSGHRPAVMSGVPSAKERTNKTVTIAGNTGLFTGVTKGEGSEFRENIEVAQGQTFLRIVVRFESTTGPKADLDVSLQDSAGRTLASSTTPYQSEAIELWPENLAFMPPSTYTVVVTAYSGAQTSFRFIVEGAPI
jgi:hypothetical protein